MKLKRGADKTEKKNKTSRIRDKNTECNCYGQRYH